MRGARLPTVQETATQRGKMMPGARAGDLLSKHGQTEQPVDRRAHRRGDARDWCPLHHVCTPRRRVQRRTASPCPHVAFPDPRPIVLLWSIGIGKEPPPWTLIRSSLLGASCCSASSASSWRGARVAVSAASARPEVVSLEQAPIHVSGLLSGPLPGEGPSARSAPLDEDLSPAFVVG